MTTTTPTLVLYSKVTVAHKLLIHTVAHMLCRRGAMNGNKTLKLSNSSKG